MADEERGGGHDEGLRVIMETMVHQGLTIEVYRIVIAKLIATLAAMSPDPDGTFDRFVTEVEGTVDALAQRTREASVPDNHALTASSDFLLSAARALFERGRAER